MRTNFSSRRGVRWSVVRTFLKKRGKISGRRGSTALPGKVVLLIFLSAAVPSRAQNSNLTSLLQQGLLEEQANGNLNAAITDYRALAAEFDKNRPLAATAVFRLGECYRAQGKTNEAVAQYQRILHEFSDQETLATMSRQNLTGLGVAPTPLESKPVENSDAKRWATAALLAESAPSSDATGDDEDQEIQRIQRMVKNSPDLINREGGGANQTPLCAAARAGQLRVARYLLTNGAEINFKSGNRFTALQSAAGAGQNAMVELLLEHHADVDLGIPSPLFIAVEHGYKAVAETLLAHHANVDSQDDDGSSPLQAAAVSGDVSIAQLLLVHGANVGTQDNRGRTPLSWAAGVTGNEAVVKALLDAKADPNAGEVDGPLLSAIHTGDVSSAELLLKAGAYPNKKGKVDWTTFSSGGNVNGGAEVTPLFLAISTKQLPLVRQLLKFKADPNDFESDTRPLLFWALSDTNILEALLDTGAKVDATETLNYNNNIDKRTALDAAASQNETGAVEILLKHGANPNIRDQTGDTALHWAAFQPVSERIFSLLLDYEADPNVRDAAGKTPLDYVETRVRRPNGVQDTRAAKVELLHRHGALDNPPNWDTIELAPASSTDRVTIFRKGTNDWNQFTLLEALLEYYTKTTSFQYSSPRSFSDQGPAVPIPGANFAALPFPNLTRVVIVRPNHESTNVTRITVNLLDSADAVDCSKDVSIKFGDVVEISQCDHPLGAPKFWLRESQMSAIINYLHGTAQLVVRDQKAALPLDPWGAAPLIGNVLNLREAQDLLLASSDLAHVKVTRRDSKTGKVSEWIVDCTASQQPDLWLRNGDVITVPEKP